MAIGQVAFAVALLASSVAVGVAAWRIRRTLGVLVVISLALHAAAALAMQWYLQSAHQRPYTAADEIGYLRDGQRILNGWMAGVWFPSAAIPGVYSYWNAFIISIYGPSLSALRLVNGLVASVGVMLVFMMSRRLFGSDRTALLAAVLTATSASLNAWSLMNLKETFLWVGLLGAVLTGARAITNAHPGSLLLFLGAVLVAGSIRRYDGAVVGFLTVLARMMAPASLATRLVHAGCLAVVVNVALIPSTGYLVTPRVALEPIGRYVVNDDQTTRSEWRRFPGELGSVVRHMGDTLFGRFDPRGSQGKVLAWLLWPEWLLSFALVPLACLGLFVASRRGVHEIVVPAGLIVVMVLVLAWVHGDPWTTYRHRSSYWPIFLTFAAGGATWLWDAVAVRMRGSVLTHPHTA